MSEKQQKTNRRLTGTVVSTKMDKTALVRVDRTVIHPKYQKRYVRSAKYKVHDPKNELVENDQIIFEECRPLSKGKCWRFVKKAK
jgi:small subunit ribosomal protein S17